jgi:hypothetical protein
VTIRTAIGSEGNELSNRESVKCQLQQKIQTPPIITPMAILCILDIENHIPRFPNAFDTHGDACIMMQFYDTSISVSKEYIR